MPRLHLPAAIHLPKPWHHSPWPMLLALLAGIPAFYDALMPEPAPWAAAMYVLSGTLVLVTAWQRWRHGADEPSAAVRGGMASRRARSQADWLLGLGLLCCAVLPASSHSPVALGWRLLMAVWTLARLIVVSKPLFERAGLARLLGIATAVLVLCGLGFYWIDPEVTTLGQGLWLAFSTAATVGYGDVVPSNTASRIFSVFVVLLGYGMLSLVTASVAAMFVGSQERKVEREILHDMHAQLQSVRQEIAALRAQLNAGVDAGAPSTEGPPAAKGGKPEA